MAEIILKSNPYRFVVVWLCLCDPMDCSTSGHPILYLQVSCILYLKLTSLSLYNIMGAIETMASTIRSSLHKWKLHPWAECLFCPSISFPLRREHLRVEAIFDTAPNAIQLHIISHYMQNRLFIIAYRCYDFIFFKCVKCINYASYSSNWRE